MNAGQIGEKLKVGSPFNVDNQEAYHTWLENKMDGYPKDVEDIIVEVKDTKNLAMAEFEAIRDLVKKTNMAIYAGSTGDDPDKAIPAGLAQQFGLSSPDNNMGADEGITELKVVSDGWRGEYIPYTNRPIHWHTDGYYNDMDHQISALLLHCVSPAASGGENASLDHEVVYVRLRQVNTDYIRALMDPDVMMIPANINKYGKVIRPDCYGPVFTIKEDGSLHMRYTARARNIVWKDTPEVHQAVNLIQDYLHSDSPCIFRATLQPGQGLISNNVLHDRSGFENTHEIERMLYRLRYYQRIENT